MPWCSSPVHVGLFGPIREQDKTCLSFSLLQVIDVDVDEIDETWRLSWAADSHEHSIIVGHLLTNGTP